MVAAVLTLASLVAVCFATPASAVSRSAAIALKRAEVARVEARMATSRAELATALASYEEAGAELDGARSDLEATTAEIGRLDTETASRQSLLDDRVATMYKTGGFDMLQALLSVETLEDLFSRMDMLSFIQDSDTKLLTDLTTARRQSAFLQQQAAQRETELIALRQQADARLAVVNAVVAQQQALIRSLGADILKLVKEQEAAAAAAAAAAALNDGSPAPPVPYEPNTIISDANYLDTTSLSVAGIQAFLDGQPGALRSFSAPDHTGVTKTAAEMISEAAVAWGVSPKVILVTLQKEQSLISRADPTQNSLDWAMGCGKMDSRTIESYRGFGNQIWGGARALQRNRASWRQGISLSIDGSAVYPSNSSTHSLYRYTPHFHGNTLFWTIYWRYFGNPTA